MLRVELLLTAALLTAGSANAELVAVEPEGFVSEHELKLDAPPDEAYRALTDDVHAWWDPAHSYSGDAANFSIQATAGGCFCERLADGGSVMHMQVVQAIPGKLLRLFGGLGPLQGLGASGAMDFAFEPSGTGTLLKYRYSVHGFFPAGLDTLAPAVDRVQLGQLERLKAYLEER
jgi:uncharacterized protein YndB with AHSA1/START domain